MEKYVCRGMIISVDIVWEIDDASWGKATIGSDLAESAVSFY